MVVAEQVKAGSSAEESVSDMVKASFEEEEKKEEEPMPIEQLEPPEPLNAEPVEAPRTIQEETTTTPEEDRKKKGGLKAYLASLASRNKAKKEYLAKLKAANEAKKKVLAAKKGGIVEMEEAVQKEEAPAETEHPVHVKVETVDPEDTSLDTTEEVEVEPPNKVEDEPEAETKEPEGEETKTKELTPDGHVVKEIRELKKNWDKSADQLLAEQAKRENPQDDEEKTESSGEETESRETADVDESLDTEMEAVSKSALAKVEEAAQSHATWTCCGW